RGADTSPVDPTPYVAHGHGRETTFQQNLLGWGDVVEEAQRLAAQVLDDIRADGRRAVRVGVKLRYAPFETRTRSLTLSEPTFDEQTLVEAALSLLERFDSGRAVRLLGVRLEMEPPGAGSRC
ncbi:MAG: DNA polymerase IV, partial [Nocardioidaceae bacterium]